MSDKHEQIAREIADACEEACYAAGDVPGLQRIIQPILERAFPESVDPAGLWEDRIRFSRWLNRIRRAGRDNLGFWDSAEDQRTNATNVVRESKACIDCLNGNHEIRAFDICDCPCHGQAHHGVIGCVKCKKDFPGGKGGTDFAEHVCLEVI